MSTAMYTPAVVWTVVNVFLCTITSHTVQPNLSSADTVDVFCLCSDIPDNILSNNAKVATPTHARLISILSKFMFPLSCPSPLKTKTKTAATNVKIDIYFKSENRPIIAGPLSMFW